MYRMYEKYHTHGENERIHGLVVAYSKKGVIHRTREPKPAFGMMLQGDGSFHHWFGDQYAKCSFLALIDDSRTHLFMEICRRRAGI